MKVLIVSPWVPQFHPSQLAERNSQVTVVRPEQNTAGMRVDLILHEGIPADRREELLLNLRTRLRPGGQILPMQCNECANGELGCNPGPRCAR